MNYIERNSRSFAGYGIDMKKINKIGVQLFTVGAFMKTEEDIKRTFERLKKLGYDEAQTAGMPCSYDVFSKLAKEAGIDIVGTHEDFEKLIADPEVTMNNHKILDTDIIGIGGLWDNTTKDGFLDFISKANEFANIISEKGFTFSYHNHSFEFEKLPDGTIPFDMLVDKLNTSKVSFVLDTYWVQYGGGDVRHLIEKLSGRIKIIHLKDMAFSHESGPYITEIGNGNLYWDGIIETALNSGVEHFVVEQDSCPGDPFDSLKISSDYLHANFF